MKSLVTLIYAKNFPPVSTFKPFKLQPNKLFMVENIDEYLATFGNTAITIQFFKPALEQTLKLDLSQQQVWLDPSFTGNHLKYVVVRLDSENSGSRKIYYFIRKYRWLSERTVELELLMDVLNTLRYGFDYSYNPKTAVIREHVDRFELVNLPDDETAFFPVVDKINEEINPTLWGRLIGNFKDGTNQHWNLVYRNVNDPSNEDLTNPVECFLVPDNDTTVKVNALVQTSGKITPDMLTNNVNYVCYHSTTSDNTGLGFDDYALFKKDDGTQLANYDGQYASANYKHWYLLFRKQDGKIYYSMFVYQLQGNNTASVVCSGLTQFINVTGQTSLGFKTSSDDKSKNSAYNVYNDAGTHTDIPSLFTNLSDIATMSLEAGDGQVVIKGINAWNKSDAKIIKIIKCPYLPDGFTITNGVPVINNDYQYTTIDGNTCLKLIDLNKKFKNGLVSLSNGDPVSKVVQSYSIYRSILIDTSITPLLDITSTGAKKWLDPKLYASEFYMPKFSYDSFSVSWLLENVDIIRYCHEDDTYTTTLYVNFYTTSSVNSRFAFEFENYGNELNLMDNDYPSFILASRNNEVTLYNVPYINYIRSGYNYDVKNKNQANFMNWLSVGVGIGSTAITSAIATASGGFALPMAITTGASTIMSLSNAISSTIKNERTMAEKLQALKMQSASVVGSDDLDLLERYSGNYLRAYEYKPSDEVTTLINKYFFYTGYKRKRMGVPNLNTRYRFNFVQVEPVLNMPYAKEMPSEIYDELVRIMRAGYTIIHYHADDTTTKWDFDQEYNNVENSLLGD